jgi:hypothetical protein
MLVPRTADGFRARVSTLRFFWWEQGCEFHTFSLLEDHCVRLLSKNLGRQILEDVVLKELETLVIRRGIPAAPL